MKLEKEIKKILDGEQRLNKKKTDKRNWTWYCMREGILGYEKHSYAEIAREYSVSPSRVPQVVFKHMEIVRLWQSGDIEGI